MKKFTSFAFLALAVLFLQAGCHKVELPPGLTKPYPTMLTFTLDGKPLDKAKVTLVPDDPALTQFIIGGETDAAGKLDVFTMGQYRGAPVANYSVVVTKINVDFGDNDPNVLPDGMSIREYNDFLDSVKVETYVVGPEYGDASTTPLKISVKKGKNEFTLDDIPEDGSVAN